MMGQDAVPSPRRGTLKGHLHHTLLDTRHSSPCVRWPRLQVCAHAHAPCMHAECLSQPTRPVHACARCEVCCRQARLMRATLYVRAPQCALRCGAQPFEPAAGTTSHGRTSYVLHCLPSCGSAQAPCRAAILPWLRAPRPAQAQPRQQPPPAQRLWRTCQPTCLT